MKKAERAHRGDEKWKMRAGGRENENGKGGSRFRVEEGTSERELRVVGRKSAARFLSKQHSARKIRHSKITEEEIAVAQSRRHSLDALRAGCCSLKLRAADFVAGWGE
jgi:hypothetical protein